MQKRKNLKCFQKILFSVCTFFSVFLIFSCKSPVQLEQVEPLKLIDGGSPVIVYIPVSASKTFVEYAMTDFFDFSQKSVDFSSPFPYTEKALERVWTISSLG